MVLQSLRASRFVHDFSTSAIVGRVTAPTPELAKANSYLSQALLLVTVS